MIDDFMKSFNKLKGKYEATIVFMDFLDYSINQFIINPNIKPKYRYNYTEEDFGVFFEMFQTWIITMEKELQNKQWFDFFGTIYEDIIQSSSKASSMGQFYTPSHACDVMVATCINDDDYDPIGKKVYDACCGSGRLLLAYQSQYQGSFLHGEDLDEMSCKMTVLNFLIHGVVGSVVWIDSLSREFYGAWKVNEFLNFGTPVPHVMVVDSEVEARCFIGDKGTGGLVVQDNEDDDGGSVVLTDKGQTTLI